MPDDDSAETGVRGDGPSSASDVAAPAGDDGSHAGTDYPVRRGSVDLRRRDGGRVHHDEAFVRYEPDAFVVATDASFPAGSTDRYPKEAVAWVAVRHPRR